VDEKGRGNAQLKGPGGTQKTTQKDLKPRTDEAELLPSLRYLNSQLKDEIASGKIEMRLEQRGLVVSLREAAFFPSGDDAVEPAGMPSLQKVAGVLQGLSNPVRLEGHTDSVPIHTTRFRSNWDLSAARSIAMLGVLSGKFSIPSERFSVTGYADTAPVASNDTAEGRARNRRVDIVILNHRMAVPDADPKAVTAKRE
jgi:chemotaxis protein MotB